MTNKAVRIEKSYQWRSAFAPVIDHDNQHQICFRTAHDFKYVLQPLLAVLMTCSCLPSQNLTKHTMIMQMKQASTVVAIQRHDRQPLAPCIPPRRLDFSTTSLNMIILTADLLVLAFPKQQTMGHPDLSA